MTGGRLARRLRGRPKTVDALARRAADLERELALTKRRLREAGAEASAVDEPWVLLDYPSAEVRIVASAQRRQLSTAKEPHTVRWLEESLAPGDVLYDIGANVGAYALIAGVVQPQAEVYAFEPGYESYAALCRNIVLNDCGDRVTALPIALGERSELLDFSFQRLAAGNAQHHIGADPPFAPVFTQRLIGLRLDDLGRVLGLPDPTQVKLDVDGYELAVLRGGDRVLSSPALRELQVEVEPGDDSIERALASYGFRVAERNATPQVVNIRFARPHGSLTDAG